MNKTIRSVASAGLLALLVGFAPTARGQDTPSQDNNSSSTTAEERPISDIGNEAQGHIDRMVVILNRMDKVLSDMSVPVTASTTQPEQPAIAPERPAQVPTTEDETNPAPPERVAPPSQPDEQTKPSPSSDLYQPTMPEDIIGPQQPGQTPEAEAEPMMPTSPDLGLSAPEDSEDIPASNDGVIAPMDMEDPPMPTPPNEVQPPNMEEEAMPSPPDTAETLDLDGLDELDDMAQPESKEETLSKAPEDPGLGI